VNTATSVGGAAGGVVRPGGGELSELAATNVVEVPAPDGPDG
jgi:hypothetical protein